jgi:hypothetical protein
MVVLAKLVIGFSMFFHVFPCFSMFCADSVSTELVYITAFGGRNSWESLRVLLRTGSIFNSNCASQQSQQNIRMIG